MKNTKLNFSSHRLILELVNLIHLLGTRTVGIEFVAQPLASQTTRQLEANDTLAHAEDLGIVAEDAALDAEAIMRGDGTNALDFVGRDGNAEASAADQESAVGLALGHETGGSGSAGWIGCLVSGLAGTDVDDFGYTTVGFKVALDGVFIADAGFLWRELSAFANGEARERRAYLHRSP